MKHFLFLILLIISCTYFAQKSYKEFFKYFKLTDKTGITFIVIALLFATNIYSQSTYYLDFNEGSKFSEQGDIGAFIIKSDKSKDSNKKLFYLDEAYKLSNKMKDSTMMPYIYFKYINIHKSLGNREKELEYLFKTKELIDWKGLNHLQSKVHVDLAGYYQENGENDKAIENHKLILKHSKYDGLKNLTRVNLSTLYRNKQQLDLAKVYVDYIIDFYKKNKALGKFDRKALGIAYRQSSSYSDNYKEKIKLLNKSIQLLERGDLSSSYEDRARVHLKNKKNNLTISDNLIALNIIKEAKLINRLSRSYRILAKNYLTIKKPAKAIVYLDSSSIYLEKGSYINRMKNAKLFYQTYEELKQYDKAFFYSKIYSVYQDSVITNRRDQLFIEYGKKYQTEKKIQENEILKKENQIKDLEVAKQKTTRNYLIALSTLGLFLLIVLFNRFKAKQKTNKILADKNTTISNQKIVLEETNSKLSISNQFKEKVLAVISHDLINPFNSILGFSELLESEYDGLSEKEIKEYIAIINKGSNHNYTLVKNLLDWSKVQFQKNRVTFIRLLKTL